MQYLSEGIPERYIKKLNIKLSHNIKLQQSFIRHHAAQKAFDYSTEAKRSRRDSRREQTKNGQASEQARDKKSITFTIWLEIPEIRFGQ